MSPVFAEGFHEEQAAPVLGVRVWLATNRRPLIGVLDLDQHPVVVSAEPQSYGRQAVLALR
jgi:hypothetical protein